ncbi:MAG: PrsW family glutamic-type intramembrane protease [Desulfosudis oleivorans]|nr:PrsW family glutamic-type intramembrane protease [Desulfosudis oleivorans]
MRRAVEADPRCSEAHYQYAFGLKAAGDLPGRAGRGTGRGGSRAAAGDGADGTGGDRRRRRPDRRGPRRARPHLCKPARLSAGAGDRKGTRPPGRRTRGCAMIFCFLAVSAIAPSLLIVWYFHKRDVYPEPPRVLWATFGLGVLTVFPVVAVEMVIQTAVNLAPGAVLRGALDAFCVAAFTEESFKLLVLLGFVWRRREFNEPMDGIVYGVVASLGFATLENVLYVFQSGVGVAIDARAHGRAFPRHRGRDHGIFCRPGEVRPVGPGGAGVRGTGRGAGVARAVRFPAAVALGRRRDCQGRRRRSVELAAVAVAHHLHRPGSGGLPGRSGSPVGPEESNSRVRIFSPGQPRRTSRRTPLHRPHSPRCPPGRPGPQRPPVYPTAPRRGGGWPWLRWEWALSWAAWAG